MAARFLPIKFAASKLSDAASSSLPHTLILKSYFFKFIQLGREKMKHTNTTKISLIVEPANNEQTAPCESKLCTLTTEEILAVAGGPEVDIETGNGG
ncbi:hypothetical protein UNDYM_0078 [Undibacterium sp. YM2]|nr:hypothetical protein UNDYM_0078 [Undibacterium sp. YM2]